MSEEDVVTLVVKRDDSTTFELRVMWEESCKHSANCVTKTCREVIQDHFRQMVRPTAMVL